MIPTISTAFIDFDGRKFVSFDLLAREDDGRIRSIASVSFCDGIASVNFLVPSLAGRRLGVIRLARKYEARAVCQVFRREVLP